MAKEILNDCPNADRALWKVFEGSVMGKCDITESVWKDFHILRSNGYLFGPWSRALIAYIDSYLKNGWDADVVSSIDDIGEMPTFDVVKPDHTFWSNGLVSHNTTIALQALAQHQKKYLEEEVALVDSEYSLDEEYAKALGVDMRYLIVNQPENGEQALNVISQLIQAGVRLIVVDSVAALTPKSELEGDVGEGSGMAEQARIMSKALRRLTTEAGSRDVTIFWTNQVREKLNVLWGDKTTTPAGHALKHYASIRVKVDRIGTVKEKINGVDVAVCNKTRADVRKNKTSPPFRVAIFYISYGHGIDMEAALLDGALARKVVQKRGAWINFGDQMLGQGRIATLDLLRKDKEIFDKVSKALEEAKAKGVEPEAEPETAKVQFKRPKSPVKPIDADPDDISSPEAIAVESEVIAEEPETSVQDA